MYAALFSSAARGTMRADSDLDVFVVRRSAIDPENQIWREQIVGFTRDATAWTGNDTRVLEYSDAEVRTGLGGDAAVLADIIRDEVRLAGPQRYLKTTTKRRQ